MSEPVNDEIELLKKVIFDSFKHVALQQMIVNKHINSFYQIDNKSTYSVEAQVNHLSDYIERLITSQTKKAVEEARLNGQYELLCYIPDSTIVDIENCCVTTAYDMRRELNYELAQMSLNKLEGK